VLGIDGCNNPLNRASTLNSQRCTVAVEVWLRQLRRKNSQRPLDNGTKAKIRNILSVFFNHAIRYEWLEQGRTPIKLVRQSAQRMKTPEVLEPVEIQIFWTNLSPLFRLMVLLDATTGLRRSELLGLKWCDIDFSNFTINISRLRCQTVNRPAFRMTKTLSINKHTACSLLSGMRYYHSDQHFDNLT